MGKNSEVMFGKITNARLSKLPLIFFLIVLQGCAGMVIGGGSRPTSPESWPDYLVPAAHNPTQDNKLQDLNGLRYNSQLLESRSAIDDENFYEVSEWM